MPLAGINCGNVVMFLITGLSVVIICVFVYSKLPEICKIL